MDELELLQDVRVCGVRVEGMDVHVDIYGGASNVCGTIRFSFDDEADVRAQATLLRRWERDATELAFLAQGSNISLTNLATLLDSPA